MSREDRVEAEFAFAGSALFLDLGTLRLFGCGFSVPEHNREIRNAVRDVLKAPNADRLVEWVQRNLPGEA